MKYIQWFCVLAPLPVLFVLVRHEFIPSWEGTIVGYGLYLIFYRVFLHKIFDYDIIEETTDKNE